MMLHFHKSGTGPPVLLLHGLLGSLDNLRPATRPLTPHFTVHAVDLRNHGQSHHTEEFNYAVMVDDLVRFCDQQKLEQVHLVGHSMGGKTAMHFALAHPQRMARLVVVDMAPRAYAPRHDAMLDALLALNLVVLRTRAEAEAALTHALPDVALRKFLLRNLRHDNTHGLRWRVNLRGIRDNYRHLNSAVPPGRRFAGPALFVRGERSDYITDADLPDIREHFPRAELHTIAHAGHWVHADAPAAFAAVVREFLLRGNDDARCDAPV